MALDTGEHPNAMAISPDGRRLFVASANSGVVNVFDTIAGVALEEIATGLYPDQPRTTTPDALALSPDGRTLVVAVADLNVHVLVVVLIVAAVLGDSVNYAVGRYIGPKAFQRRDSRWFRQEYLRRTQAFYDRFGGVTIIIGRFVPIIRTFAPFLAGVAGMSYRRFLSYNVIGGVLWISLLVYAGYLFGNIPWVKQNLSLIVIVIVIVSLIPAVSTFVQERRRRD